MQRKRPTSTKKKKKKRKPQRSTEELIRDGDHAVDVELDPTKAVRLYTLALPQLQEDSSPRSEYVRVLTRLGEAKVSLGDPDDAKQHFLAALEAGAEDQPSQEHANLYLYLGQLSVEQEALEMYEKGIGALETAIANDDGSMTDEDNTNRVQLLRYDTSPNNSFFWNNHLTLVGVPLLSFPVVSCVKLIVPCRSCI